MQFVLNAAELQEVFRQDPATKGDGGFQSLLVGLQNGCVAATGAINVNAQQRGRIRNYAYNYGNGGWENRLVAAFGRHLGPKLDLYSDRPD